LLVAFGHLIAASGRLLVAFGHLIAASDVVELARYEISVAVVDVLVGE
jgi:hypothetical protein